MADFSSNRDERFLDLLRPIERELEIYSRRMIADPDLARDALQNAVLKAFRHFDRYHPDASFRAWIYKILTNEIRALRRRRQRIESREAAPLDEAAAPPDDAPALWSEADGGERALHEALDDGLARALDSLTENERAVLVLRAVAALKYRDIAEVLDMPLGSVMGHLSRARRKVRGSLARQNRERRPGP